MVHDDCPTGWTFASDLNHYVVDLSGNAEEAWEFQMIRLASAVYRHSEVGSGWVEAAWSPDAETSQMGIYMKGDECVLSFGGTDDMNDVVADITAMPYGACGEQFHKGFVTDVIDEMRRPHWAENFVPILTGPVCNGDITVVGHSLGAAMAAVFSVCANSPGGLKAIGVPDAPDINVKALYTIGEPEITYVTAKNGKSEDGCFKGARVYNANRWSHDPIPRAARAAGFVHPQLNAVMYTAWNSNDFERNVFECGKGTGAYFGSNVHRLPHWGTSGVMDLSCHSSTTAYLYQSARIWR